MHFVTSTTFLHNFDQEIGKLNLYKEKPQFLYIDHGLRHVQPLKVTLGIFYFLIKMLCVKTTFCCFLPTFNVKNKNVFIPQTTHVPERKTGFK